MRFLILLVAGAMATDKCINAAGDQTADTCWDDAAGTSKTVACTATTCVFTRTPATAEGVAAQWGATWDAAKSLCDEGTALVAGDNCAYCKGFLNCGVDTWAARAKAEAGTDGAGAGWTDPATCGDDLKWYTDNPQDSCVDATVAAWGAANMPTCADAAVAAELVMPTTLVYGADGTTCTKAIADKCIARASCTDYATHGPSKYTKPAGSASDADTSAKASPAAMISAGIALLALLF